MLPTWRAGEHIAISGQTGSGKSVLMSRLLDTRSWFVLLKSKADSTKYPRTRLTRSADVMDDPRQTRIILRPRFEKQSQEFSRALNKAWKAGGWTVAVDELFYVDNELGLRAPISRILTQGRDPGRISMVTGMQRPSLVTRFALGEASHVISFGLEGRDIKILQDATNRRVADIAAALPRFNFVWYHVPTRAAWTGKLDMKTGMFI